MTPVCGRLFSAVFAGMRPLQSTFDLVGSGVFALVVTFLAAAVFYAITLHLAATFFVGDVPSQRAAYVAPVPAVTSLLLMEWGALVVVPVTLLGDLAAIRFSYRLSVRASVILTVLHFTVSVLVIIPLNNIFGFG